MRIPKYWTRAAVDETGREVEPERGFWALGWSDVSMDEAKRCAVERARRIVERLSKGQDVQGGYPYPNRPIREQIIERDDGAGWAITRNSYGSLVLNAANAMFVDIDLPVLGIGHLIGRLFGKKKSDPSQAIIEQTRQVVTNMSGMGARLYRTAGGFRLLITSETYDPTGDLTHDLLKAFGTDQRYATLCKVQECFRARLTPKPWRCGVPRFTERYPFKDYAHEQRMAAWVSEYDRAIRNFGVCHCIESIGNGAIAPAIEPIVKLHDQHACRNGGAPLA
ncbi:MAG: hypothetical protein ACYC26_01855 [Phycisphaerales bacterium]